jgi:nucleoid DNA-binding protein
VVKNKKDLILFLADKYNLTIKEVEKIVMHQFKFVANIMSKGNFETVRLPYFGKFSVNQKRVKFINKLKNETSKKTSKD